MTTGEAGFEDNPADETGKADAKRPSEPRTFTDRLTHQPDETPIAQAEPPKRPQAGKACRPAGKETNGAWEIDAHGVRGILFARRLRRTTEDASSEGAGRAFISCRPR